MNDLKTTARKDGAGYVLNGAKAVVIGAPWASHLIVTARTGGAQRDDRRRLGVPGRQVRPRRLTRDYPTVDGRRASEVTFDNVKLGADALIGPEGEALPLIHQVMDEAIAATCAEACGVLRKPARRHPGLHQASASSSAPRSPASRCCSTAWSTCSSSSNRRSR